MAGPLLSEIIRRYETRHSELEALNGEYDRIKEQMAGLTEPQILSVYEAWDAVSCLVETRPVDVLTAIDSYTRAERRGLLGADASTMSNEVDKVAVQVIAQWRERRAKHMLRFLALRASLARELGQDFFAEQCAARGIDGLFEQFVRAIAM